MGIFFFPIGVQIGGSVALGSLLSWIILSSHMPHTHTYVRAYTHMHRPHWCRHYCSALTGLTSHPPPLSPTQSPPRAPTLAATGQTEGTTSTPSKRCPALLLPSALQLVRYIYRLFERQFLNLLGKQSESAYHSCLTFFGQIFYVCPIVSWMLLVLTTSHNQKLVICLVSLLSITSC